MKIMKRWSIRLAEQIASKRRGFVLVTSILSTSIIIIVTLPYISRVANEYQQMAKIHNSTAALDVAEAGIERALWEISYGANKAAFTSSGYITGWTASTDGFANPISTSSGNAFVSGGANPKTLGYYDVSVLNDTHKSYDANTSKIYITATGCAPTITSSDKKKVKIVYLKPQHNFATRAISAIGNTPGAVTFGVQDKVDSYNSALGTYSATHQNANGNIATNGSIVFGTQASVYGDARPGAAYPFSSKPSNVSGAWGTLAAPATAEPIPANTLELSGAASVNNNSNLVKGNVDDPSPLDGSNNLVLGMQKTVTLPGGTYYFKSIYLDTQSRLNVNGTSTIYVDKAGVSTGGNVTLGTQSNMYIGGTTVIYVLGGNVTIGTQAGINNPGVPKNLILYSTGATVSLTTQTDFYGAIYAPNAAVSLTTQGDIFGAVVSKTFTGGTQAGMHFDLDLLNVELLSNPYFDSNGVESWQEVKT